MVEALNFSVQITAEQDALKVSLKETVSVGSCDLQTCHTGRETDSKTCCDSKVHLNMTLYITTALLLFSFHEQLLLTRTPTQFVVVSLQGHSW